MPSTKDEITRLFPKADLTAALRLNSRTKDGEPMLFLYIPKEKLLFTVSMYFGCPNMELDRDKFDINGKWFYGIKNSYIKPVSKNEAFSLYEERIPLWKEDMINRAANVFRKGLEEEQASRFNPGTNCIDTGYIENDKYHGFRLVK